MGIGKELLTKERAKRRSNLYFKVRLLLEEQFMGASKTCLADFGKALERKDRWWEIL